MASAPVTRKFTNISTEDEFQFIFQCDRCGAGVRSEKYNFSTERFEPPPQGRARALLWTRQHDEAYERANWEARFDFNICPACGRRVCDSCFYVSPEAVTDICVDCKRARDDPPRRKPFQFRWPILGWLGTYLQDSVQNGKIPVGQPGRSPLRVSGLSGLGGEKSVSPCYPAV